MNVIELLRQQVNVSPATVALVTGAGSRERVATFRELDRMAARVAHQLHAAGIGEGARVLLLDPLGIRFFACLLGVFQSGATAVLVDPSAGWKRLDACCARVKPSAALLARRARIVALFCPEIRRIPRRLTLGAGVDIDTRRARRAEIAAVEAAAPALLTFTSGSTGTPKVAVRTHGFLRAQHETVANALGSKPGEVELTTLPVFVISNLAAGMTSLLPDADLRRPARIRPAPVVRQALRWEPGRALGSPSFFSALSEGWPDGVPAPFRRIFTGGGPVFPRTIRRLNQRMPGAGVTVVYGSTEAEPISHVAVSEISEKTWQAMGCGRGLYAGKPIPAIELRILPTLPGEPTAHMKRARLESLACKPGEGGEIVVSGAHVLKSYLDGEGDRLAKFRVDGEVWHRTGDAGLLDEHGGLWLLGRCEAVIRDKHGVLYPFAAECAALQHDFIASAACLAWEGERALLVVPSRPLTSQDAAALQKALEWARLAHIATVKRIPLDARHNAKVEYPALRRMLRSYSYVRHMRAVEAGG